MGVSERKLLVKKFSQEVIAMVGANGIITAADAVDFLKIKSELRPKLRTTLAADAMVRIKMEQFLGERQKIHESMLDMYAMYSESAFNILADGPGAAKKKWTPYLDGDLFEIDIRPGKLGFISAQHAQPVSFGEFMAATAALWKDEIVNGQADYDNLAGGIKRFAENTCCLEKYDLNSLAGEILKKLFTLRQSKMDTVALVNILHAAVSMADKKDADPVHGLKNKQGRKPTSPNIAGIEGVIPKDVLVTLSCEEVKNFGCPFLKAFGACKQGDSCRFSHKQGAALWAPKN